MDLKKAFRFRPSFQTLEDRTVRSVTAGLSSGVLAIQGTDGPDTIHVRQMNDRISVEGLSISVNGQQAGDVAASDVKTIVIYGGAGDDIIRLDSEATPGQQPILKPATVYGGDG